MAEDKTVPVVEFKAETESDVIRWYAISGSLLKLISEYISRPQPEAMQMLIMLGMLPEIDMAHVPEHAHAPIGFAAPGVTSID